LDGFNPKHRKNHPKNLQIPSVFHQIPIIFLQIPYISISSLGISSHFSPFSTQAAPWLPGIHPARGSPAARRGEAKGPGDALLGAAEM